MHNHTHRHTLMHNHTRRLTHPYSHIHTHTHSCTYGNTHTHTHTHVIYNITHPINHSSIHTRIHSTFTGEHCSMVLVLLLFFFPTFISNFQANPDYFQGATILQPNPFVNLGILGFPYHHLRDHRREPISIYLAVDMGFPNFVDIIST